MLIFVLDSDGVFKDVSLAVVQLRHMKFRWNVRNVHETGLASMRNKREGAEQTPVKA